MSEFIDGILVVGDINKPTSFSMDFSLLNDIKKIVVRENSKVEILISHFLNSSLEIETKEYSSLSIKYYGEDCLNNLNIHTIQEIGSTINMTIADFSNSDSIAKICFDLNGEGSSAIYKMASISSNKNKKTFDVSINHIAKSTYGLVDNYGVSKDESKLCFLGTSWVINGAINSKTRQNAKIMVFDEKSSGICKPILKIDENEIEASHGASLGKPNEEHMFYLMSRGLNENQSKALIVSGYLNPILKSFENLNSEELIMNILGE